MKNAAAEPQDPLFEPLRLPSSLVAGTSFHIRDRENNVGDLVVWKKVDRGEVTGGWVFYNVMQRAQERIHQGAFKVKGAPSVDRTLRVMLLAQQGKDKEIGLEIFTGTTLPRRVGVSQ